MYACGEWVIVCMCVCAFHVGTSEEEEEVLRTHWQLFFIVLSERCLCLTVCGVGWCGVAVAMRDGKNQGQGGHMYR